MHRFPTPARLNCSSISSLSLFPSPLISSFSDWRWPCAHAHGTPRISEIDASYLLDMTGQQSSWWSRVSGTGKVGFDKAWNLVDKLGAPVNKLSNKLGSEAFWPTTLDKESDKAARILRSFCSMSDLLHPPCSSADLSLQRMASTKKKQPRLPTVPKQSKESSNAFHQRCGFSSQTSCLHPLLTQHRSSRMQKASPSSQPCAPVSGSRAPVVPVFWSRELQTAAGRPLQASCFTLPALVSWSVSTFTTV